MRLRRSGGSAANRRGGGTALVLATTLAMAAWLVAGCTSVDGTAPSTPTTGPNTAVHLGTTPLITEPPLPVQPVAWIPCGQLQCGSVTVPLDYANPGGSTIQIAVARHPALDPMERIGSLVLNPGGPGASGIDDLPNELSVLTRELLDRFDIVSFDPRGVERSSPVQCSPPRGSGGSTTGTGSAGASTQGPAIDPVPTTSAAQQALLENDRAFAAQCERYSGTVLPFVGTVDTARDLDRIRAALGDARLTFIGHSYGTLLGATYAELFPSHVRAMVLDGAIDPALSATSYAAEQAQSFEAELNSFFGWCADTGCPWHIAGDPTGALLALIQASRVHPLTLSGGGTVGPAELYESLLAGLGSQSSWPTLAAALAAAEAGNGTEVAIMSGRYETGGSSNGAVAEQAIDCLDHPVDRQPSSYPALAARGAAAAPVFGPLLAWGLLGCATWPALPTRAPGPASDPGAPPILVVGTTGDPVTPYRWAVSLSRELSNGVLLTWVGQSHVAYFYSSCARAYDQAYLVDGALPASGATCTN